MNLSNVVLNGNVYTLIDRGESASKKERWMAVCPLKGDSKWFAATEDRLTTILEEEEGAKASDFKAAKRQIWATEAMFGDKPVVTWNSDGSLVINTPRACFKFEVKAFSGHSRKTIKDYSGTLFPTFNEDGVNLYERSDEVVEHLGNVTGFYTNLIRVRIKDEAGNSLRDYPVNTETFSGEHVLPIEAIEQYLGVKETTNPLIYAACFAAKPDYWGDDSDTLRAPVLAYHKNEMVDFFSIMSALAYLEEDADMDRSDDSYLENHPTMEEVIEGIEPMKNLILAMEGIR